MSTALSSVAVADPNATDLTQYEQAVRYQLEMDTRDLVAEHFKAAQAQEPDAVEISVEPRLLIVSGEPWLAGVHLQIDMPASKVDPSSVRNLLLASYSAQGFDVSGSPTGDKPYATITVNRIAADAQPLVTGTMLQIALMIGLGGMIAALATLWLKMRRLRAKTRAVPVPDAPQAAPAKQVLNLTNGSNLEALVSASASDLRNLFQSLPLQEAIHVLSRLTPNDRRKILDDLAIQSAVRRRIEDRLAKIYSKA